MDAHSDKQQNRSGNPHPNPPPENLASSRWQKGQSGNPNGRPKVDLTLTSLLKKQLTEIPQGEKHGRTWREILVLAWLTGAVKNPVLMREILDRVDGRVLQPVGGEGGGPILIRVVYGEGNGHAPQARD